MTPRRARIGIGFAAALLAAGCASSNDGSGTGGNGAAGGSTGGSAGGTTGGSTGGHAGGAGVGGGGAAGSSAQVVGTSGGTVTASGLTLAIPAAALPADTTITVATTTAPAGYALASAAYQFGPSGTQFAQPVTVTIPLTSATPGVHLFWSNASGGFDDVGGTITGTTLTASVSHFSIGFCAVPAHDAGASDAPTTAGTGGTSGAAGTGGGAGGTATGGAGTGGVTGTGGATGGATGGSTGGTGGSAGSTSAGTGGTTMVDAGATDAGTALCNSFPLNLPGTRVTEAEAGAPPTSGSYIGGPIASGSYFLTSVTHYGTGSYTGIKTAEYIIDATAKTIRIGERPGATYYVGYTFDYVGTNMIHADLACTTTPSDAGIAALDLYYTFAPKADGSVTTPSVTMTEAGSSDVLFLGPP